MKAADLPDVVIKAILDAGYERDEIFSGAFCNIDAFEKWLVKLRAKLGEPHAHMDPEDWGTSPTAAKIRIFWRKLSASGGGKAEPSSGLASGLSIVPFNSATGAKLSTADRDKLRRTLESKYSSAVVTADTLPAMSYLQAVHQQVAGKQWEWLPWKRILSEEQSLAVRGRSKQGTAGLDGLSVWAAAVGLQTEEWDLELGASAMRVQQLLETRAFAHAMVGAGHLHSWVVYTKKLLQFYCKKSSEYFRPPNVLEAEASDRAAMEEVFQLCFAGHSLDDALHNVAVDRDLLRHLLVEKPRVPKLSVAKWEREPLKRKKGAKPEADSGAGMGECFLWRQGKCKRAVCKFNHACGLCGAIDHCAKDCASHKEKKARVSRQAVE